MGVIRVTANPIAAATPVEEAAAVLGGGGKLTVYTTQHDGQGSVQAGTKVGAADTFILNIPFDTEDADDVVFIQVVAGINFTYQTPGRMNLTFQGDYTSAVDGNEDLKDFNTFTNYAKWDAGFPFALLTDIGANVQGSVDLYNDCTGSGGTMTGFYRPVWEGAHAIVHVAKLGESPASATTEL